MSIRYMPLARELAPTFDVLLTKLDRVSSIVSVSG